MASSTTDEVCDFSIFYSAAPETKSRLGRDASTDQARRRRGGCIGQERVRTIPEPMGDLGVAGGLKGRGYGTGGVASGSLVAALRA